ncbi:MAG: hypothetical protein IPL84_04830 [Chitinophagaceae bacterium]|nr:hypothetical protein [Chitinophagaceae bacterium]
MTASNTLLLLSFGLRVVLLYYYMADVHTIQQRTFNMQQIKGKDTKPDIFHGIIEENSITT